MSSYIEYLLQLYKQKKLAQDVTIELVKKYQSQERKGYSSDSIAIVGIACRMPLANSKEAFWANLRDGVDCISEFPSGRRKDTDWIIPSLSSSLLSKERPYWNGGFLEDIDLFDNEFFNIFPTEATLMDPQQRIFLELAHEAFEDAGYTATQLQGSNTGVFIGDVVNEYRKLVVDASPSAVVGNISPFIASRVSNFYDLHGPTINVSTTCSTSLVAVHSACQSLRCHESELALVGAVNLRLFPFDVVNDPVDALGITSKDGKCRAFDNRANGIVRGEGGGALLLKRYKEALRDNNPIYAVICGSGVNNDGKSSSVGAPNPLAQADLLKTVWERSEIDPREISYIEAHGTGTFIGDPIEIQGIAKAFSYFTEDKQFCAVGSVKSNLGHLTGGASGLTGLIKTVLSLKHRQIPPTLHFEQPNELIDFPNTPLFVPNQLTKWNSDAEKRIAGVSAFGFNGTNCHLVLKEHLVDSSRKSMDGTSFPFPFSHRSQSGLTQLIDKHLSFLKREGKSLALEDVSYTLTCGREHYQERVAVEAASIEELIVKLERALTSNDLSPRLKAYISGEKVDWSLSYEGCHPRLISLPTYVFESKRFWLETRQWSDELATQTTVTTSDEDHVSIEERLLGLYKEVMGIQTLTLQDDFFDLGGDSLLGVEIINLIHKKFQKKITYNDLFAHPKIADLAAFLEKKTQNTFMKIPKAAKSEYYRLSYGQRRLWILHQMQDDPVAYNINDTYEFNTALDHESFQRVLDQLVERHDVFRTIFVNQEGEPFQKITAASSFDLALINAQEDDDPKRIAKQAIEAFRKNPFDLEKGPLVKGMLVQTSPYSYLFCFMMHHIVSDGWSIKIVIQELLSLYRSIQEGRASDFNPLNTSYVDYCQWQQQQFAGDGLKSIETFWLEQFTNHPQTCEIMGDKPRPAVFNFQGKRKLFAVPKDVHQALSALAERENATLFMVLLSSIYILIHRYSGQKDLIVGSPVSGRSHADLKSLVGFFVNTLALRCQLDPVGTFSDLLSGVKERVLEALERQEYPFDLLVDRLQLERDTSRSPLFNINLAFQNFELDAESNQVMSSLKAKREEMPHHSCKWDLEFEFIKQQDGNLECFVEYYEGIYSEEMISGLIETLQGLLASISKGAGQCIHSLEISSKSSSVEGPKIPLNDPKASLHQLFEKQVERSESSLAIKAPNQITTYDQLNKKANRLAHFLKFEKELKSEELVGIYMENSEESIVSILGILKVGGAYVALDVKAPVERTRMLIEEAHISTLLSKSCHQNILDELLWSTAPLHTTLCLDEPKAEIVDESLMDQELWDQVASEAKDDIAASGWVSSYTGQPFSEEEMEEYSDNILSKLKPHLNKKTRVLEIGCGSGLTLFKLAPYVGYYLATDLSPAIIERNQKKAMRDELSHVKCISMPAHALGELKEDDFDVIIINSVIHCFSGLDYLKTVLNLALECCQEKALLFLGDLMDLDLKTELQESFREYKEKYQHQKVRTKTDWSNELFISRSFLSELPCEFPQISKVESSKKIGKIDNELSQFRFDAQLRIEKSAQSRLQHSRTKYQYDEGSLIDQPSHNLDLEHPNDSLAYVLFTSGSTGKPKGVMVEHRSVLNYIEWAIQYYRKEHLNFPFYSPLHFDLTVTSLFASLLSGAFVSIMKGEFDEVLESLSQDKESTIIKMTPTHLALIAERGDSMPSITQFILGGEPLYAPQAAALAKLYDTPISIYNEYGPTEATVGCIVQEWDLAQTEGAVAIGKPIANTRIQIVDEFFKAVPVGAVGEILIGGDCLARGYLNHQALTDEKFMSDSVLGARWYRTGDMGRLLPSGKIEYLGRGDRQVKIRGHRVELNEIEAQMLSHPLIHAAAVLVKKDSNRRETLCGYYASHQTLASEDVRQFLAQSLPDYMLPQFLISLKSIPMTRNGKVNYQHLPNPHFQKEREVILPRNGVEKSLHEIWSRVLNVPMEELSVEDDFFDLGGDSIMAMRILPQLKAVGLSLTIKEIFQYRTILAVCQKVIPLKESSSEERSQEEVVVILPNTPIQEWFWGLDLECPEYFNMAYLFKIPSTTDRRLLEKAFLKCFEHHDGLRQVFDLEGEGAEQKILPFKELAFHLDEIDLTHPKKEDQEREILALTQKLQEGFDLSKAPLLRAAVFLLDKNEKRLFIAIHHLIIDGVSWRYLVEDLAHLYTEELDEPLLSKTASFKEWAQRLHSLPKMAGTELEYWLDIEPSTFSSFAQKRGSKHLVKNYSERFIYLDKSETHSLVAETSKHFDVTVGEILLAGLTHALCDVFDREEVLLHHEGHGRFGPQSIDVSRTMGWFTTIFPLHLKKQADRQATLLHTKEVMKRVEGTDVDYSISRYLQRHPHLEALNPEILLNYFGRVDDDLMSQGKKALFSNCKEVIGPTSHPQNKMPHLIEFNAIVIDDRLRISTQYDVLAFQEDTVESLITTYKEHILTYVLSNECVQ